MMPANTPKRVIRLVLMLGVSCVMTPVTFVARAGAQTSVQPEATFLKENEVAMTKMMDGMDVKPSGDLDRDFVAMMIPHHQGAIDMAQAELRHGKNEQLRRIAQEIIVEQQQEIVAMHVALGQPLPPPAATPDQIGASKAAAPHQPSMHMNMSGPMPNHEDQQ